MILKTFKLNHKVALYQPSCKDGYNYNHTISPQHQSGYEIAIAKYSKQYDFLADNFHSLYGEPSYSWQDFLKFIKEYVGVEINVLTFSNPTDYTVAGTWIWDDAKRKSLTIRVNASDTPARQKITIAHECIHVLQDFDFAFQQELGNYPMPLQLRIAERIAEKTAIQIFMPREKVACDRLAGLNVYEIALKYGVSKTVASYS